MPEDGVQLQIDLREPTDLVAGVDEAGRGPLAGPVVAAAVILDKYSPIDGLRDSKKLSPSRRSSLALRIKSEARAWALGVADHEEIDRLNILQASMLAMARAVAALNPCPDRVLVDGNRCPDILYPVAAVIRGDESVAVISAASILAKVHRDALMTAFDKCYPGYGFAVHKGYPTAAHLSVLQHLGACPIHRRSFAPVRRCLEVSHG